MGSHILNGKKLVVCEIRKQIIVVLTTNLQLFQQGKRGLIGHKGIFIRIDLTSRFALRLTAMPTKTQMKKLKAGMTKSIVGP